MARNEGRGSRQQRSTTGAGGAPVGPARDPEDAAPPAAELAKHRPTDQQVKELRDRD